jgi:hypothetical protein
MAGVPEGQDIKYYQKEAQKWLTILIAHDKMIASFTSLYTDLTHHRQQLVLVNLINE